MLLFVVAAGCLWIRRPARQHIVKRLNYWHKVCQIRRKFCPVVHDQTAKVKPGAMAGRVISSGSVSGGDGLISLAFGCSMGNKTDNHAAAATVAKLAVCAGFGIAALRRTN